METRRWWPSRGKDGSSSWVQFQPARATMVTAFVNSGTTFVGSGSRHWLPAGVNGIFVQLSHPAGRTLKKNVTLSFGALQPISLLWPAIHWPNSS